MGSFFEPLPFVLDGATGTNLFKAGMPASVCPEKWIIDNPDPLMRLQRAYVEAGSRAVMAPTFGANRIKLSKYGLEKRLEEINRELVAISRQAAAGALVAGNIGPTGLFPEPFGDTPFETFYQVFFEQALALSRAGADYIAIETMMNLAEARAALLAARDASGLPVTVTVTVEENGRTMSGNSPLCCLAVLESMGASAFGFNCSTGPQVMLQPVEDVYPYAGIPIIAKPNAGAQCGADGVMREISPWEFAEAAARLAAAGASVLGGCCGTGPEHISALRGAVAGARPAAARAEGGYIIAANGKDAFFISPTIDLPDPIDASAEMAEEILEVEESGAEAVSIRLNGPEDIANFIENSYLVNLPLSVAAEDPALAEAAARVYPGRLIIDCRSGIDRRKADEIAARYGAIVL